MLRFLLALFLLAILGVVAAIAGGAWVLHTYGRDLPDYRELENYQPSIVSRVHAGDGRLLAEFATEARVFVPIEAIPPKVIAAFVAAEDQRFWTHPGFDPVGIARAAVANIRNIRQGRRLEGASTITQQVAKNFFFTNEVSMNRKIKEAILAFRIERTFDKAQILELYLNEIYLGRRSYGVAAAALNYFDRSLSELSIAEAAYLAGLPKAPNNYHPVRNRDAAIARRNYVIGRMAEDGYIDQDAAQQAMQEPLATRPRQELGTIDAAYFTEEVRRELVERYGSQALLSGGLSVRSTLDPELQEIAERALRDGLIAYDRRHGWRGPVAKIMRGANWAEQLAALTAPAGSGDWRLAVALEVTPETVRIGFADASLGQIGLEQMRWARTAQEDGKRGEAVIRAGQVLTAGDVVLVEPLTESGEDGSAQRVPGQYSLQQVPEVQGAVVALDPHTGRVLAMVGGSSFSGSEFNRATQARRQPGSAFKPFVYLAALQNGFTPSSLIMDGPMALPQGPGLPMWRPSNYSGRYYGPTPLRRGLERSQNLMTVRLAMYVGLDRVEEVAQDFGAVEALSGGLSDVLGATETTLLDLTSAYAMLVNGGRRITPTLIDRIQDRNGATLYRHDKRSCPDCMKVTWVEQDPPHLDDTRAQLADPRHVYQVVSMLEGVVQRGTGRSIAELGRPLGGKTGTTNDFRDGWFIGFSPDLTVGVHVGFDDNRTLGARESGGRVAAPIFKQIMGEALEGQPPTPFRIPSGLRLVRVDPQTGQLGGGPGAIWEAFVPGTEPGANALVLDRGAFVEATPDMLRDAANTATVGTGGLY